MSFAREKHIAYIDALNKKQDDYEYWLSEHLRMNGLYWGLTALCLMKSPDTLPRDDVIAFILSCRDPNGGFGAFPRHDGHLLSTLSAVQMLATLDALDVLAPSEVDSIVAFIMSLQLENGAFQGDLFGEVDTRFVYTAINALSILGRLTPTVVDGAVEFISQCANFDGGYGMVPGAESHAAQVFTCVGTLAITNRLDLVDQELLGSWLSERQLPNGGLNGRPEKLPDVCYSWWVLSSLAIIDKLHWIDHAKLYEFILKSQDDKDGGISDRPDNQADVYHTVFGIAGLSLMGYEDLVEVDPVYCMPKSVTDGFKKWPYE
ncbi:hypothetical protein BABINDRAFT_39423 [Babjeviella inositovora NRRL Y-12698]|uniref:Geranylgeranyl transferase type-2 subunit beta n=1 Tax=Babjeviella inositovora NRRL Y-12698 TaxID=984486 RepID=A0A1E3QL61_9ASCO|nr:uncharacterized protein BABINDRAFT_39423 [Babjeviella inositovora NRRL Y-12698]ODQ78423.1 hypothetical protein BABINDRAFT_39423 [Babjeviella inositovora NRRL Y-12698]